MPISNLRSLVEARGAIDRVIKLEFLRVAQTTDTSNGLAYLMLNELFGQDQIDQVAQLLEETRSDSDQGYVADGPECLAGYILHGTDRVTKAMEDIRQDLQPLAKPPTNSAG